MIKHVVLWKVKATEDGSKEENAMALKQQLDELSGIVPGLLSLETGINQLESGTASDVVLCSSLESWQSLDFYQQHPAHLKVAEFVRKVTIERRAVDYEVPG